MPDPDRSLSEQADILLLLLHRTERLEALPRTGWLVCGVDAPESIAAHAYMVCVTALWIADHMEAEVDAEAVMRMALLHDLSESMLTDLPSPVKRFIGAEHIAHAEERAAETILEGTDPRWLSAHKAYEDRSSLESRVVKAADRIQLLAKALEYRAQHRGDTERFWDGRRPIEDFGIPLVRAILERLIEHYEAGTWFAADFD